ncbi:hypothetical protein HK096_009423, partial [Nowakowskiella sp. JEL0078]
MGENNERINLKRYYTIKPLDLILFNGKDVVAGMIRAVEHKWVKLPESVGNLDTLWTHAGVVINSSIFPDPALQPDRIYIYESIFTGKIAGYTYSEIWPVDIPKAESNYHLGPQIRDLADVINESNTDVGIVPIRNEIYTQVMHDLPTFIKKNETESRETTYIKRDDSTIEIKTERPNKLVLRNPEISHEFEGSVDIVERAVESTIVRVHNFWNEHQSYTYPFMPLTLMASANDDIHRGLKKLGKIFAGDKHRYTDGTNRKAVFCSELVARLYADLGVEGFTRDNAS